jgi:capsular polysaccharide transport system permease protein
MPERPAIATMDAGEPVRAVQESTLDSALRVQARVIGALVLRDMRTRFGRSFFGYVIIVGWPLAHLLALMTIYLLVRRVVPIGTNAAVFLGTGILPYILCLYPARMISMSIVQNQPLLYFPVVKTIDVIAARGVLEIITAFWVVAIFCAILFIFGVDIVPVYPEQALLAIFATIYLSFSIGFFSAVMYAAFRAWMVVLIIALIVMYVTSGALFLPTMLPPRIREYLYWNPLFHSVEWLRSAYYDGYGYGMLDRGYLLGVATVMLFLGIVLERAIRGALVR